MAGGLAALASAFLFSVAAVIFRRLGDSVPAAGLNLAKSLVALALLGAILLAKGPVPVAAWPAALLATSGLIGIAIGDTAYFRALVCLGPRRTLLLDTLSPGVVVAASALLLQESLTAREVAGIALTLGGIGLVMRERSADDGGPQPLWPGIGFALLSVACHAGGILLSKVALAEVPALEATAIRQAASVVAVGAWGLGTGRTAGWLAPLRDRRVLGLLLAGAFLGTFLGIFLSILALRLTAAGLASTLNATGPLFILPLGAVLLGERVTPLAVLGAAVAVAGVALLLAH